MIRRQPTSLPTVNFSDQGDVRYLHLGTEWIQGSMLLDQPFEIELEYVQRMMAWLLFFEPASLGRRHAMQLGLGAGAPTKFCYKKLRMKTTAIELNPRLGPAVQHAHGHAALRGQPRANGILGNTGFWSERSGGGSAEPTAGPAKAVGVALVIPTKGE